MSFQRRVCAAFLAVLLVLAAGAPALEQDVDPVAAEEAAREPAPQEPATDVIHLRNGRKLEGFRVLRQTGSEVLLQLTAEGLELRLPMSQVDHIERGHAGAEDEGAPADGAEGRQLHGVKLAPGLNAKLQAPLTTELMRIEERDFVAVIIELSNRADVPLRVTDSVRAIPLDQRRWTTVVPQGTSLFSVLNDILLGDFPVLDVSYTREAVILDVKSAREPQPRTAGD